MDPLVTCIIPHHLDENSDYLKLCLDSVLASEGVEFEVICVADTELPPSYPKHERLDLVWSDLGSASAKFNWAAKKARGKYLWLVSDDVMVSKYAMKCLVDGIGDNPILCNPMSNSDNGSQFYTDLGIPVKCSKEDLPLMPLDALNRPGRPFLIPVRQFIAFYCTMIPKRLWELVGDLDERMEYRGNDWDWCLRAQKLGIQPMINLGAFSVHFGDRTIPKVATAEDYKRCDQAFSEKWSRQP